jgi:hypothetical protein
MQFNGLVSFVYEDDDPASIVPKRVNDSPIDGDQRKAFVPRNKRVRVASFLAG